MVGAGTAVPGLSVPLSEVKAELFKALAHPARIRGARGPCGGGAVGR